MARKNVVESEKVTLRLFYGDLARIRKFYPSLPYNEVIRRLIRGHLDGLERRQSVVELPEPEDGG